MPDPDDRDHDTPPAPVLAVLAVVSVARAEARRLPALAVRLPLLALDAGLAVGERLIREYNELRGGTSKESDEDDEAEQPAPEPGRQVAGFVKPGTDVASAASATPPSVVERVTQPVSEPADPVTLHEDPVQPPTHDTLPLPDFDHMTLGSLRGRLRGLDPAQLVALRDYERTHADRLPVVMMLENRIAKLDADRQRSGS